MSSSSHVDNVVVNVEHATFHYFESTNGIEDISLQAHHGDRILLLGSNGCGKSTLLSLLGGKRKVSSGTITVLGADAFEDTRLNHKISLIGPPWPVEAFFANTVDSVASPSPDIARKHETATRLHLRLSSLVDKMSSGEKRRVQILHGMLHPVDVYLLDECSTDIDVAERMTVLSIVEKECLGRGACCFYATHILDGVHGWATHVALMHEKRVVSFCPVSDLNVSLEEYAHQFIAKKSTVARFTIDNINNNHELCNPVRSPIISCTDLNLGAVFNNLSFVVFQSSRTLLLGCNGSGKSTILNILGGKQFIPNRNKEVMVCGKPCYVDMLHHHTNVAYGGDWWAQNPRGEVYVREMIPSSPLSTRAARIAQLLRVDMAWDVRRLSSGEQKRVQLLLVLQEMKPLIILDEATADLDVDQRHELLQFLFEESSLRGVTILYSTHIFEGLEGWASDVIVLDRSVCGLHKAFAAPKLPNFTEVTDLLVELKSREPYSLL